MSLETKPSWPSSISHRRAQADKAEPKATELGKLSRSYPQGESDMIDIT